MSFYVSLHNHCDMSVQDAYATIPEIIKRAKDCGYKAASITDHGTCSGHIPFYEACKEAGLKPILGVEAYVADEPTVKAGNNYHILLIAQSMDGLRNIYKLMEIASTQFYKKPRISIDQIIEHGKDLVVTTACMGGIRKSPRWPEYREKLMGLGYGHFYIEVQPHNNPEQKAYNEEAIKDALMNDIPLIATNDSHYAFPDDAKYHTLWASIASNPDAYKSGDYYPMGKEEMASALIKCGVPQKYIGEIFKNVTQIVDSCNVEIPFGGDNFPKFDCGGKEPERLLRDYCNRGWQDYKIRKKPNWEAYKERVLHELPILNQCDYTNYLLIIRDILNYCKSNRILSGIGRGSVSGCLTAYLAGVHGVDSIKYDLIFERFCNPERVSSADRR